MLSYSRSVSKVACDLDLGRPDVILGSSVHLFAVYTAYRLSRRLRAPFVMEVRDIWPQTLIDMGVSKWHPFVLLLGFLERYLYKKAIRIITLLPRANEHIESFGVKPDKIVWIPNGVDGERFDAVQVRPEESSRQFTITYTGAIGTANNLTVLLKAAEILGNEFPYIKFLIVGDGPEKPRLLRMADDKKLENVEFKAPVPKDEVSNIHSQSDALLFTLQDSPVFKFGISSNKLFDYLTSGKPVIFSCNSANNPVNEAGAGITIPPDDPQKLVDTAIALSEMPIAERAKMGSNGRQYIEKHHLIATLVDRLEQIFITA